MKNLCLLLIILVAFTAVDNFKVRGQYKVVFSTDTSKQQWQSCVVNFVNDSTYKSVKSGKYIDEGKVIRFGDTACLIDTAIYHPQGHLDSMIYRSFGKQIIEFKETGKDTLKFKTTYASNLHVTLNEGVLIRMK